VYCLRHPADQSGEGPASIKPSSDTVLGDWNRLLKMSGRLSEGKDFLTWPLIKANAPEMKHMPRVLALDGGGVRGLSSLLILQRLMQEVQRLKGDSQPPLPCEYFDLICGTSTGGLIAIMLGRLRMVSDPIPSS
jgi:hypothetical protein